MVSFSREEFENECEPSAQGLSFAQRQLEKHGWSKGKGLGKDESGRADAIKVGVKNDTLGVGYDIGKEFTCHWWDHVFNKTASNIVVEQSENGIQVCKKDSTAAVTRPKKLWRVKGEQLYYGRFVKAKNDSGETVKRKTEDNDVITIISDEELLKACGGRTAHKSARHGHKLSGKLKRIAEQENISSHPANMQNDASKVDNSRAIEEPGHVEPKKKKKKRKKDIEIDREKKQKSKTPETSCDTTALGNTRDSDVCLETEEDCGGFNGAETCMPLSSSDVGGKRKRKRKDKKKIKVDKAGKKKTKRSKQK